MNVINCTDSFSEKLVLETINFWSENSFQHIEVLQNAYKGTGAVLFDDFKKQLDALFKKFKGFYDQSKHVNNTTELLYLLNEFLVTNDYFIKLLERLKFEGFNGYPYLYQTVYHFLYEQKYTRELFRPIEYTPNVNPPSVLITAEFKNTGLGMTAMECIYNQMYFWCIIGAQHPSIIGSVSPAEDDLPQMTKNMLQSITNKFNNIAHQLSGIYNHMTKENMHHILMEFKTVNIEFLKLLDQFDSGKNSKYFSESIKKQLPKLFFGVLGHIEDEHEYVLDLCKRFEKYLSK